MSFSKEELARVKERLYFIRWTFVNDLTNKPDEDRTETFSWDDRQQALNRYLDLQDKYYAHNVKFQVAQPQDVDINSFFNSF